MDINFKEAAALATATDEELAACLAAHADQFQVAPRATFALVCLDPRKRPKTLDGDAKRLLGVEIGQLAFVILVFLLARSVRIRQMRWPQIVGRLPGYAVGTLSAYWTIQRVGILPRGMT
ncbi:MAG: hypothetical protein WCE38_02060 [Burkholderiales bacterium]